ncbi:MAG: alpha/beta hydrolase [Desulfobulbaceae bacterium]|nr:alpha/beta hydrolase [Desulfobulbaceae bacterium]
MKIALLALLLLAALMVWLGRLQRRMIYAPRPYPEPLALPSGVLPLEYRTAQGRQTAFYLSPAVPPSPGRAPNLWLLCGGNSALALDWLDLLSDFPDPSAAFLLLDYPGYGRCQGRPSPAAISESSEQALLALASHLHLSPESLESNLHALGHSLGAAAVLLTAARHPLKRLVLISPFTSLQDMAAQLVGKLLSRTLLHDYPNRSRLRQVLSQEAPVAITIIHGSHDKVVPVAMGRELAALSPRINYREIAYGDHNYILLTNRTEIRQAMCGAETP